MVYVPPPSPTICPPGQHYDYTLKKCVPNTPPGGANKVEDTLPAA